MNFTTDLPKKNPYVTYIVASAVKSERFFPESKGEGPSFRMHAVILHTSRTDSTNQFAKANSFILCHIRKIDSSYKSGQGKSRRRKQSRTTSDLSRHGARGKYGPRGGRGGGKRSLDLKMLNLSTPPKNLSSLSQSCFSDKFYTQSYEKMLRLEESHFQGLTASPFEAMVLNNRFAD